MSAQLREARHVEGRLHMQKGAYIEALEIFLNALSDFGPHVGLISDIAAVYYLTGRIEDWQVMSNRLESELSKAEELLSDASLIKTRIFLGKMFEEQAEVQKALQQYQAAEKAAEGHPSYRLKAQAQRLRLMSFLGVKTGLADLYRLISTARSESAHFEIEFEHALMLAEMSLFGTESASSRLVSLFSKEEIASWDLRLLYVDYAEDCLQSGENILVLQRLRERVPLADCDEFEKIVLLMSQSADFVLSPLDLNKLSSQLPLMGLLRLMILQIKRSNSVSAEEELRRRFLFLLDSLTSESRNLLLKKWQSQLENTAKTLYYSTQEKVLFVRGQNLPLKRGSFAESCLRLFLDRRLLDMELFVKEVFEAEYNDSYYDRVRIAISRLNKDLAVLTGSPRSFIISKQAVELAPGLTIRKT